ncbi:protein BatD [Legionella geestiana]|uniref:BatD family protein n=1 Tax=Legionella geestiana TaxID=45065 RepID=UPI001092D069|nr:BatD family protein [Legionella geestiana]QDQ39851.1 protein BatD [Legionella geestiana]
MKRWAILFLGCVLAQAVMAAVTLRITPQPAQAGEPVQITLIVHGKDASAMPDLTPLQGDFTITGTSRSIEYRAVNGQAQTSSVWTILAVPKHSGMLKIPSITIGTQSTPAQTLIVSGAGAPPRPQSTSSAATPDVPDSSRDGLWFNTQVDTATPFVNQQVVLTVRLYSSQQLLESQYTPPAIDDGLIVPLGNVRTYREVMNGEAYTVDEQQYAVFAQKSGPLTIKPPFLRALVLDTVPRRIKVRAKPVSLTVNPILERFSDKPWLIANDVKLSERYDTSARVFKVGSAISRTIRIEAAGAPGELLPALTFDTVNGANAYPETPKAQTRISDNRVLGTLIQKVTWVLDTAGEITLPGVQVPWYNAQTGKTESASLPPLKIRVVPAAEALNPEKTTPAPRVLEPQHVLPAKAGGYSYWLAAVLGAGWLSTVFCWWWRAHRGARTLKRGRRALRRACRHNNAQAAEQALLALARQVWPDARFLNLADIRVRVDSVPLQEALSTLEQTLYGAEEALAWNGQSLWRAFCHSRGLRDNAL